MNAMSRFAFPPRKWSLITIICFMCVHVAPAWIGLAEVNETQTDGTTQMGDALTVTWSIVPDGTAIPTSFLDDKDNPVSDFIAVMDEKFDVPVEDQDPDDLTQRPWFTSLAESFELFTAKTGLTYVYVHESDDPNDADTGTPFEPHALGVAGKRGDARIAGAECTGVRGYSLGGPGTSSGYNGNIIFNTKSSWNQVTLKTICSHENMHSVGSHHSFVTGGGTLSYYSTKGPQLDDLYPLHYKYGDVLEKAGGNDSPATATDLGTLALGGALGAGSDIPEGNSYPSIALADVDIVSIDANTDTDVFKFHLTNDTDVQVRVSPRGAEYEWDVGGSSSYYVYGNLHSDLQFEIQDSNGTVVESKNEQGLGEDESTTLALSAGDYYVVIQGDSDIDFDFNATPTQFYALEISDLAPTANPIALTVAKNGAVAVTLSGSGGDNLSYALASTPTNGTLTGTAPDLIYTPNMDFSGEDQFTFTVNDGTVDSEAATVSIEVIDYSAFITIERVTTGTGYDIEQAEAVAFRSTGVEKTYDIGGDNAYGTEGYAFFSTGSGTGTKSFETYKNSGASWVASIDAGAGYLNSVQYGSYTGFDNPTAAIATDVADWSITGYARSDTGDGGTWEELVTFTIDENAPDFFRMGVLAGNNSGAKIDPSGIRLSVEGGTPVEVTGLSTAVGMVFFDVSIQDGMVATFSLEAQRNGDDRQTAIAGITFDIPWEEIPVANSASVTVDEDRSVVVTLTGSDPEGDSLTYAVETQPTKGALSGTAPDLTYTPEADYNGADSFTFTASDGDNDSLAATVSITITPVNDRPVASPMTATVNGSDAVSLTLSGSDIDGDSLTYTVESAPSSGSLSGTAPNLIYTPNAGLNGSDSFTFSVSDGTLSSAAATVSIHVTSILAIWDFDAASELAETQNSNLSTGFAVGAGSTLSSSVAIGTGDSSGDAVAPYDALRLKRNDGWDANDFAEAKTSADYFEFTLTPDTGYAINLGGLSFSGAIRNDDYSPEVWTVTSSADGHAAAVATGTITTLVVESASSTTEVAGDFQDFTVDLSGAVFQDITNAISFRVYINDDDDVNSNSKSTTRYDRFIFAGAIIAPQVNEVPASWLESYGLELTEEATLEDPDGDGLLNWQEYMAGTNPTNAASVLKINGLNMTGNEMTFDWQAVAGKTYSVWFKTSLTDTQWSQLTNSVPGVEPASSVTIEMDETNTGFIRIQPE